MGDTVGSPIIGRRRQACYHGRGSAWHAAAVNQVADNRPCIRIILDSVAQLLYRLVSVQESLDPAPGSRNATVAASLGVARQR